VIILDSSAGSDWLLQTPVGKCIEDRTSSRKESLHTVQPLDLEVSQVLRRLVREGAIAANRADQTIRDLLDLRIYRYPPFRAVTPGLANSPQFDCVRRGLRRARRNAMRCTLTRA